MTTLRHRPAEAGDVEALAELHVAAWRVAYLGIVPDNTLDRLDLTQRRFLWRGLLVESDRPPMVDVALASDPKQPDEETLVGFIWTRQVDQAEGAFDSEIVALNVLPTHWRRGVGRCLMGAAAERLTGLGAGSVYLWVFRDNGPARRFYGGLGGRIVDEDAERFGDVSVPTVAYAWKPLSQLQTALRP